MSDIQFNYKTVGRQGTIALTICTPDGKTFTDKLDITKESARSRLLALISEKLGPGVAAALEPQIQQTAKSVVEENASSLDEKSQADELVELAVAETELFHTPGGYDSEGFASIEVGEHRESWQLGSRAFRRWLAKRYHDETRKAPNSSSIEDALTILAGKAIYEGAEHEVSIRIAGLADRIYLDLGDPEWHVVEITADGWRVLPGKDAPVWFVRKRGMMALPVPARGGNLRDLRALLNLADDTSWVLLVGCLLGYLRPTGPYPILIIDGEHGSAKSTACRFIIAIVDPRKAALRRPPKSERDLMIAASNSWLVGFDNLSGIAPWLSDALCSLATGGGFGARELFSDDSEKLFDAMRPVMMNGIDRIASRADLLDRAVPLQLPSIPEEKRARQSELDAKFQAVLPGVLGALLDGVSAAIGGYKTVKLERLPRMADFATWVVAAEPALGWKPGTFLAAYMGSRAEANEVAIETSPIGSLIVELAVASQSWEGTCEELLEQLESRADEKRKGRDDWPDSSEGLSKALRRIAPNLRAIGLEIEFKPRKGRRRPVLVARGTFEPPCDSSPANSDGRGGGNCHPETGSHDPVNAVRDSCDGCDSFPGAKKGAVCEWES